MLLQAWEEGNEERDTGGFGVEKGLGIHQC